MRIRKYIGYLMLIQLLITVSSFAQHHLYNWTSAIGGTGGEQSYALASDTAGNVYITGRFDNTSDFDPGPAVASGTSLGSTDAFIAKYSVDGSYLWSRTFGGTGGDNGLDIVVDSNGNVFVTGRFQNTVDFDPGPGVDNRTSVGGEDIFFSKYDTDGTYIWTYTFGGTGSDNGQVLAVDNSNNIYLGGVFYYTIDFNPFAGVDNKSSNGNTDVFVSKYNSDGSYAWTNTFGGTSWEYINDMNISGSGKLYLTGTFLNTVDFNPGVGVDNRTSLGSEDIFLSSYDSDGNYIWTKAFGSVTSDSGGGVITDTAGNIYIGGSYQNTVDFDPGAGTDNKTSNGGTDIFLTKYNTDGSYAWTLSIGGTGWDGGGKLASDATGNIFFIGSFQNTVDFDPGPGVDNRTFAGIVDMFISKYNPDGSYAWTNTTGGAGWDSVRDISSDTFGNLYLTGYFGNTMDFNPGSGIDNRTPAGSDDMFITRYDSSYTISGSITSSGSPFPGVTVDAGALGTTTTAADGSYSFINVAHNTNYLLTPSLVGYSFSPSTSSVTLVTDTVHNFSATLNTYTISGTVTASGSPLSGVSVNGSGLGSTTTAADGTYNFTSVPHGTNYTLTPSLSGYDFTPGLANGTLATSAIHDFSATLLVGTVSGTIIQNGVPVEGATVTLTIGGGSQSVVTGPNGNYAFHNITPGNGTIVGKKEGISLINESVTIAPNTTVNPTGTICNPSIPSPAYTFWNGFLGMVNILEILNPNNSDLACTVKLHDLDGNITSTSSIIIAANSQRDLILNDLSGFSTTSYGLVSVDSGNPEIDGRITYYRSSSDLWASEFEFVFSLPFLPATSDTSYAIYNSYNPSQSLEDLETLIPNWLSVANLENTVQNFTVTYRDQDGHNINSSVLAIPPFGKRDIQAGHEFSTGGAVGLVSVAPENSSTNYIATVNRYGVNNDGSYSFSFGVPTRVGNPAKMLLPAGGEGLSVLELANISNNTNSIAVSWHDQEGTEVSTVTEILTAYSQKHFIASAVLGGAAAGTISIDGQGPVIAGTAQYFYDHGGRITSGHYTEARESFGTTLSGSFNTYLGMDNWLRLGNLTNSNQTVVVGYGNSNSTSIFLPAYGRRDAIIPTSEQEINPYGSYGSFTLTLPEPGAVSASMTRSRIVDSKLDFITTTPVR